MTAEWHGEKLYDTCYDCGSLVQLNKSFFGSLHICKTECEKRGYHIATEKTTRFLFWKKTRYLCQTCKTVLPTPRSPR